VTPAPVDAAREAMDPTVWTLLLGGIVAAAAAFPKVLGNINKGLEDWVMNKRRAAEQKDDADIADLQRQVEHLSRYVHEIRGDIIRRDACLSLHSSWDYKAVQLITSLGGVIEPPPPLWPLRNSPEPPGDGHLTDTQS